MDRNARPPLKRLKISCATSDCGNGLHCFQQSKKLASQSPAGACQACGAQLVDWGRVHKKRLGDADYMFKALQLEWIRHYFFHLKMEQRAVNYARRKGKEELADAVRKQIRRGIGDAEPFLDGRQTRMGGDNPIDYARHATASCCRKCVAEWHGIPTGRELADEEIAYLSELAMRYLNHRLPDLKEVREKVSPIRRKRVAAVSKIGS
jgi:hypothetical protein